MGKFGFTFSILAASAVGYAIYFDYQRRNSKEFRQKLHKSEKEFRKNAEKKYKKAKEAKYEETKTNLLSNLESDPIPTDLDDKEQYFMKQVAQGEQLCANPGKEFEAALCFYKALAVYPNPADMLGIYQRSTPEHIYELVIQMVGMVPPLSIVNILGEANIQPADNTSVTD